MKILKTILGTIVGVVLGLAIFFILLVRSCVGGFSNDSDTVTKPEKLDSPQSGYYLRGSKQHGSYIWFDDESNSAGAGNKWDGRVNCSTDGNFSWNASSNTINVYNLYNSNCSGMSKLNGTWTWDGKDWLTSPSGGNYRKVGSIY